MIKEIAPKTFKLNGNKSLKDLPMNDATWFLMKEVALAVSRVDWDILFGKAWTVRLNGFDK